MQGGLIAGQDQFFSLVKIDNRPTSKGMFSVASR